MSLFCPTCANGLLISTEGDGNKWTCQTCPYEFPITKQMTTRVRLRRKQVDDIMGGEDAWKNVDATDGESRVECDIWGFVVPSICWRQGR